MLFSTFTDDDEWADEESCEARVACSIRSNSAMFVSTAKRLQTLSCFSVYPTNNLVSVTEVSWCRLYTSYFWNCYWKIKSATDPSSQ